MRAGPVGCVALLALCAPSCTTSPDREAAPREFTGRVSGVEAGPDAVKFLAHVSKLASDEFAGRLPGSKGEDLTVDYLVRSLKSFGGIEPVSPGGSFTQDVPLVGFRGASTNEFRSTNGTDTWSFAAPDECVLLSRHLVPEVAVDASDVVFVGYGIVAPEYGWDDYKGVDVRGKTIVMLVNDPPVADAKDPSKLDESMFGGRAMTYYGRWTYKYEIAAEKGAAAVLIVHDTAGAGYPFEVVRNSFGQENFDLDSPTKNAERAKIEGWLREDKARELCTRGGSDLDTLRRAALSRDFKPVPLALRASFHVANTLRPIASKNVVARLPGSDPKLALETIVFSAHWDHFGPADGIYNGAIDNATGVAGVLEIARVLAASPRLPRSFVFLFVTAEERGLLGSRYYAEHPRVPLENTLCDINLDSLNVWGRTVDVESIGFGASTLDEVLIAAAAAQNRVVRADSEPEKGGYYRSDHFEFAKRGVPGLYADSGSLFVGRDPDFGRRMHDDYTAHDYHKPSDEVRPDWDLSGAMQDLALQVDVGRRVAVASAWPEWKQKSEFRERREKMLARTR
jgi:Zn-dependent M28 family amino/carboxypeptidase